MKAVVIGTGIESLASALRLRALGHEVDVLEASSSAGEWTRGVHFQGALLEVVPPTISSPWLFDELFALFKERRADVIEFIPSHLYRRNMYADGSHLDIVSSTEEQEIEIARLSPDDARNYRPFLKHCEALYNSQLGERRGRSAMDLKEILQSMPNRVAPKIFSNLWRGTGRYFSDRRVRQAFSWVVFAAGLNPLMAPARCGSMHEVERRGGVWSVRGGWSRLVGDLVALGERHGIRFHYDHKVVRVSRDQAGRISSIDSAHRGERVVTYCDLVVCGGGSQGVCQALEAEDLSPLERIGLRPAAPSFGMYQLFFKTKRSFPELCDQTIVLSDRWEGLLSQIRKGPRLPKDPTFSLQRLSPPHAKRSHDEGELFTVFVPVPHLERYSGWKFDATGFKDTVLTKLRERVLPGLTSHLVFAESIDPRYARDVLTHPFGTPFPLGPIAAQAGGLSFQHRMHRIPNLFLSGACFKGVWGIPGALTSASLIAEMVRKEFPGTNPCERLADIAARSVA